MVIILGGGDGCSCHSRHGDDSNDKAWGGKKGDVIIVLFVEGG